MTTNAPRELEHLIKTELLANGADVVAFGDLTELPPGVRAGLPVGVSFGICLPRETIRAIADVPTPEYYGDYKSTNAKLQEIIKHGERFISGLGYSAIGMTNEQIAQVSGENFTTLPLKTVATRAGLGWIGKCALLVTEKYGSALRLGGILTDAPLPRSEPVNESRCGACMACTSACPAHAPTGALWHKGLARDAFFNAAACRKTAYERAVKYAGAEESICGKCIAVCPHTRRYVNGAFWL
ncbi:MAG: 4Fe-4S binding protein [Oscillospiraceae bacterium]|jgi:epoxyqueuosine reductase QueG|nr:4Fe-4S binding protein [Oscillospiraceae bacterium]